MRHKTLILNNGFHLHFTNVTRNKDILIWYKEHRDIGTSDLIKFKKISMSDNYILYTQVN